MSYLHELYRHSGGEGHLSIWSKQTKATHWFAVSQLERAALFMTEAAISEDIYFGWCLFADLSCVDENVVPRGPRVQARH